MKRYKSIFTESIDSKTKMILRSNMPKDAIDSPETLIYYLTDYQRDIDKALDRDKQISSQYKIDVESDYALAIEEAIGELRTDHSANAKFEGRQYTLDSIQKLYSSIYD